MHFFIFTESKNNTNSEHILRNSIYRYEWIGKSLVNPTLIFTLPAKPGLYHDGGKLVIGPDNNLYAVIGDLNSIYGTAQNHDSRRESNGTSGILRINPINGSPVKDNPFIPQYSENNNANNARLTPYYYAYGIRNSFGMAFDPVTGILWDTENGPDYGDEINLVNPGFNSGWQQVQGIWVRERLDAMGPIAPVQPSNLVDFGGKGVYHLPQFTWNKTIGPTAIKFLDSGKLGDQYENDMFVADIDNGNIYHFQLNHQRDGLVLSGALVDKVADNPQESQQAVFATGFGGVTDLQVGPEDGDLYVLSFTGGAIYRIVPSTTGDSG